MTHKEFEFRLESYKASRQGELTTVQYVLCAVAAGVGLSLWGYLTKDASLKGIIFDPVVVGGVFITMVIPRLLLIRWDTLSAAKRLFLFCPNCKNILVDQSGESLVHEDHCGHCKRLIVSDDPATNRDLDQLARTSDSTHGPVHVRGGFGWEYGGYFGRLLARATVWAITIFAIIAVLFLLSRAFK